jgi:hypothetical protein
MGTPEAGPSGVAATEPGARLKMQSDTCLA